MKKLLAVSVLVVSAACGGGGEAVPDAGDAAPDAGVLPEFELKIDADFSYAATVTADDESRSEPAVTTRVDDVATVTYTSTFSKNGGTGTSLVEVTRTGRGLIFKGKATASSPDGVGVMANAEMTLSGFCVTAREAGQVRLTYACAGEVSSSGSGLSAISANSGAIPICNRSYDSDTPRDQPWDREGRTEVIDIIEGLNCWHEGAKFSVLTGGGKSGGMSGSSEGTITVTVEPIN